MEVSVKKTSSHFRTFLVVWFGQLISLIGSGLTHFVLGVWVYQQTGSVTQFALIPFFSLFPSIVLSPIAGVLVDRYDRRWAMILSDLGSALSTTAIWALFLVDALQIWHIYVSVTVASICESVQWPAYSASTTLLVPKEKYGQASGMVQMGQAISQVVSPLLAGTLITIIALEGVLTIDIVTFLFALLTLFIVRFPRPRASKAGKKKEENFWKQVIFGWQFIKARHGLLYLLLFFTLLNLNLSMVMVLITPLILSFTGEAQLGIALSVAGLGMVAGTIVMSVWGGPKKRILGVVGFACLNGFVLLLGGLQPNMPLVTIASFIFLFSMPILSGCSQVIWQSKVEADIQGRVFSIRRMIGISSAPLAYLLAGPVTDYIFEPLLSAEGMLSSSVGSIIGTGPGRGIGFLFMILGMITIFTAIGFFLNPRFQYVETELPDAINLAESYEGVD